MTDQEKQQFFKNMKTFLALAKSELGIKKLPKIIWILDSDNTGQTSFGGFVLKTQAIRIVLKNRHPNDVMRTLAHELVHYKQWTENRLDATSGDDGSAEENEANAKAGVIMRQFNRDNPDSFGMKALSEGSKMIQTTDPKSLDSIYGIQAYDRDKRTAKKQKIAAQQKAAAIAKKQAGIERRAATGEPDTLYLCGIIIPTVDVKHWRSTRDEKWAYNAAKRWGSVRHTWPKEVLDDLYNNPEWQRTIINLWDFAALLLKLREMPRSNRSGPDSGRLALDRVGSSNSEIWEEFYKLLEIVKNTLVKHNVDKTGNRLPTGNR
jgi:hypothetical protein